MTRNIRTKNRRSLMTRDAEITPVKPVKFDAQTEIDFLIIGSGAAGGIIAKELATAGFRIVVLEQGPYLREKDFKHDEFSHLQQRALTNDYKRQPNTFRQTEKEEA